MSDSGIQPGDFVQYAHLGASGIGKVIGAGDSLLIQFWNEKEERKSASGLTPLSIADAGPVELLWDSPRELTSWAKEKPLKLVALALFIDGGKGNPGKIKEMLDGWVPLGADWKTWWAKRAKSLNALSALPKPEYFTKSAKGNDYTLRCGIEKVPDDAPPPASLAEWKEWLLKDVNLPTVGKSPSKLLCDSLAEWPEDTIGRALDRVLWGAERFLESPKKSAKAALDWMDAVGSAARRWGKLYPDSQELTKRSGEILARFSESIQVKEKRKEATLFWAGALSESPDRQRQLERQRQEQERQRKAHAAELEKLRQERESDRVYYEKRLERERLERERREAAHVAEVKDLRAAHARVLEEKQKAQDNLRLQAQDLAAELGANREESRLEIRQDMLLAVGEVLQSVRCRDNLEDVVGDVEAGLRLALISGGAEPIDTAPKGYDPQFHFTNEMLHDSCPVKVTAPGVIVRSSTHGDLVLLKAQVKSEVR